MTIQDEMRRREPAPINLFLVEDSSDDIALVQRLLHEYSMQYFHLDISLGFCHTIKEAEQALQSNSYNLILLDLSLPDSVQLSGLKTLVVEFPNIPIVVYSGCYSQEMAEEAIYLGAQDYILKGTMTADDLVKALFHAKLRHKSLMRLRALITSKNETE